MFNCAIQKYGWDGFDHIVLFDNLTRSQAIEKEIELIKEYDSYNNGYNSTPGGNLMSDETKKLISELKKGKPSNRKGIPMSEEQKAKLSKILKGRKGQPLSKETKAKISKSNSGQIP